MQSALRPAGTACVACSPSASTQTSSPGPHVAHEVGADEIERAGLRRDDPVVPELPERERAEAERVAEGDERVLGERGHGVRALEPGHRVRDRLDERALVAGDQRGDELRVRAGEELTPSATSSARSSSTFTRLPLWPSATVRARAVMDERLRVRPLVRAGGRVARVADRGLARKRVQLLLVEHVRDEAHLAQHGEPALIRDRDARGLLAAVLEREQAEVRETRNVPLLRADAEDAHTGAALRKLGIRECGFRRAKPLKASASRPQCQ